MITAGSGKGSEFTLEDYAWRLWLQHSEGAGAPPAYFVNALELAPEAHLLMQAALQPYVDSAISKTINVPEDCSFSQIEKLYREAYVLGLRGCTTFRTGCRDSAVLRKAPVVNPAPSGCMRCDTE